MDNSINDILSILIDVNRITHQQANKAITVAEQRGVHPVEILIEEGIVSHDQVTEDTATAMGLTYLDLSEIQIRPEMAKKLPSDIAKHWVAVPVGQRNEYSCVIAIPLNTYLNLDATDNIERSVAKGISSIDFVISPEHQILDAIKDIYRFDEELGDLNKSAADEARLEQQADDDDDDDTQISEESKTERLVTLVLLQGIADGSSDIIFESREDALYVRYRIDGIWYEKERIEKNVAADVLSVVKLRAGLDIATRNKGQDGRMRIVQNNKQIDFRVNSFPIQDGENITIRVLDNSQANKRLEDLGFSEENLDRFLEAIKKPQGLILVTGPTGSGKSVTLYSGLNVIASPSKNTYTIEDPIEYRIDNVKQSQINPKAGWTYPRAIEAFMRSAPDNILVGEVRNLETAKMALEAGMTGHLVLSTLHTNSAAEAAARLMDMGAEPDVVSMTLTAVVAQRLVRKLCDNCKIPYEPSEETLKGIHNFPWNEGEPVPTIYKASETGCKQCRFLGFKGRTAAHEVLLMNNELRNLIIRRATAQEIEDAAIKNGMVKILQDGFKKVLDGITTPDEVMRSILS